MTPRTVRKILAAWQSFRARRRLYRAMPDMRDLDRELDADRRRHRAGARIILARKRKMMTERLAAEVWR